MGLEMRIAIAGDHAGFSYKQLLASGLAEEGHEVLDLGPESEDSVDYPDYAEAVAGALADGRSERGILVCGSALGMAVAANKIPGIRAGVSHDTYSAHQGVEHDDINVLCIGARIIGIELAKEFTRLYPDIRVVLTSGYTEDVSRARTGENEPFDFIQKPALYGMMARKIREALDR